MKTSKMLSIENNFAMNFRIIRWPLGCLICLLVSCNHRDEIQPLKITKEEMMAEEKRITRAHQSIQTLKPLVQTGDLITRTGNDFTSESLRSLNQRDKKYSHCGIALVQNDTVFVFHALGGEFNPDQKLLKEPLEIFADPLGNRGIGIYRFTIDQQKVAGVLQTVQEWYQLPITFDMKFDLETEEKMYCAEFVAKSYQKGTNNLLLFPLSKINNFLFFGVDDLFLHPSCQAITEIVYK